jgi:hypothetical protein
MKNFFLVFPGIISVISSRRIEKKFQGNMRKSIEKFLENPAS